MSAQLQHRRSDRKPRHRSVISGIAILIAIINVGCAGGLTGSTAQIPCPTTIEAPVLYPGDTWILRYADGQRLQRKYLAVKDGLLQAPLGRDNTEYYYDHTHTLQKVYSKNQWVTAPTPTFWSIGKPELEFPLTPGRGWSYTLPNSDDYSGMIVTRHTVVGCEEVTVPAGKFVAVRIDVSQVQANRPANAAREWSLWYAPDVKFFVKRMSSHATFWPQLRGFELESFTIDVGKPTTK